MARAVKKTIFLPPELARQVEEMACAEGKTLSVVVQEALRLARLRGELKELQGYWTRRAKERGIITEDDLARLLRD